MRVATPLTVFVLDFVTIQLEVMELFESGPQELVHYSSACMDCRPAMMYHLSSLTPYHSVVLVVDQLY